MNDRYDVVIAGAGPAGAQCARDIAARGYDVVVLETEAEDEFPRQSNKSTAGTFHSMMSAFGIPDDVVMQYTDSVVLESPTEHYVRDQPGAVLEFADFKRYLVEDGRETGAEYRFDARVTAPIMEGGEIAGVRYNGDKEVYGDIVVDATGPSAPLAKQLDVVDLKRENHAIGIEYEFEGIDIDRPGFADLRDAMMLRLDHEIAPGGYSWIFHTGEDTAKVGLCYIQNEHHSRYAKDGHTIDDYMEHWLETDPRFSEAERIAGKQHRGSAHIQKPGQLHTDRFMAIGDTVPTVDPLWGEGINKCMQSGRVAAMAADSCLKHDDIEPTAENLAVYDTLWHRDVAPNVDNRLLMTRLLYLAPNERYDKLMRDLERLDDDTLAKANKGNFRAIARLLELEDAPLLAQLAKQHFDLDFRSLV
ncbi:NAD(P)/FAD-dependent oxidoreductase [Natrinema thermotolerans]|uniref:NAD(P)/FAD-dependent oxidoreductase n=1 Tax=Natrinema thermotolerans TaxID=121872 RepID=A0AAF0PC43_9EURY|nr:digeranylgeranylglycerophospholipid reductase [Natrinema thermotolerans]QCC59394.1 NAD(P)/FAD-dependent oxidoreductase [Natrinema thermotolerans]WMT06365.1 NAD(P)/FAD-dependent oxidoreductase [Natrinema thermotolerans]